jgi:type I restriction enzyme S subunit
MSYKIYKIKDIGEVVSGTTPSTNNESYWNGNIKWITPAELIDGHNWYLYDTNRKITEKAFKDCNLRMLPRGTILLTSRAPIGKVAIVGEEMCTNQGFKSIICNPNYVNSEYLYFWLLSKKDYLHHLGRGATFKEISKSIVENIEVPLPSLEIQNKIVEILKKALNLIDKRKAQIEALDQLTQSVFLEMFGDPWINPKKWRVKKIKEVIKNKPINGFFAKNEQYSDKGNAKIIWISDFINKRSANIHGLKKVVATEEDIKKYQVKYGDILFCRSSLNVDGIGKAAYVPEFPKDENIIFECHIIKITLSDEVLPEFFQVLSETKFFRNQIIKHSKTSTMTTISQSGIMECSIIVPPVQIQNQFLQILKKIEYEKQKLQNSLSLLNDNFNSLMQRAFKGELFND